MLATFSAFQRQVQVSDQSGISSCAHNLLVVAQRLERNAWAATLSGSACRAKPGVRKISTPEADPPLQRPCIFVAPVKFAWVFGRKLVIQRDRVVVVDQQE